jgi:hypothetical protein
MRMAEHAMSDEQEKARQEYEELQFYLWTCLSGLREHISPETYAQVEKDLGFGSTQH